MSILNSNNQSANSATMPANGLNEVGQSRPNGRNRFDINYLNFFTPRFGELTPFLNFQTTEQDSISFASRHEVRAYTFSAPLMSGIKMCKDTFAVPYNAILPRNWELFYKTPKFGDDIPDGFACAATNGSFYTSIKTWVDKLNSAIASYNNAKSVERFLNILRHLIILESIFSAGSLPSLLGYHTNGLIRKNLTDIPYDFDGFYNSFAGCINLTYEPLGFYAKRVNSSSSVQDWHRFFNWLRLNPTGKISSISLDTGKALPTLAALSLAPSFSATFNYSSLVAYQMVCAQFYTNDNIDEIYCSDLYLSLAENVADALFSEDASSFPSFTYNGSYRRADVFSWKVLSSVIGYLFVDTADVTPSNHALDYLSYLFVLRPAPKFGDYFVGARKNPLALGDVSAPVISNKVSAVKITESILMQRFLNAVNKVGSQIQEFERQLLGGNLPPDVRLPKMISHEVESIKGDEVEQTSSGNDLGKIVQNTRSYGGKYAFETSFSCPAIIIGICYFDASRVYSHTLDRIMMQEDRYDMFNPYLQTIGDQPVYLCELRNDAVSSNEFAYQLRHAEFKQRYNVCSGGFVDNLPSWAFIADNDTSAALSASTIDSDYIRCDSSEFDRFYSSLTGYSLDKYFHFIVKMDNSIIAKRSMLRTPSIL